MVKNSLRLIEKSKYVLYGGFKYGVKPQYI